jgi:hypothetical protein
VKRVFGEAGRAAVKTKNCYFMQKWASIHIRFGFKKAIVAIGDKILQVIPRTENICLAIAPPAIICL